MFKTEDEFIEFLEDKLCPYILNEKGRATARTLFRNFPAVVLEEAIDISMAYYLRYDENGKMTKESVENCVNKVGGIAHNKMLDPIDAAIGHVFAVGKRAFNYWNDNTAREILKDYINALRKANYNDTGVVDDLEREVIPLIKDSGNWSSWRGRMNGWTNDVLSWTDDIIIEQSESILPETLYAGTRGYIERLAQQINASYENNLYDCCAVMLRRLMEVLLVLSFQNYDKEDLILDNSGQSHVSLDKMIKVSNSCNKLALSSNTKRDMLLIKELGNFSAHKIWYNCTKKDIEPLIPKYRAIIEELLYKAGIKE